MKELILNYKSLAIKKWIQYLYKEVLCMVVKEIKSDSTIIRFDNRDIVPKDKSKEIINILTEIIIKNFQNTLE